MSVRPAPRLPASAGSGRSRGLGRIVGAMSATDDTTPSTAPDGSTEITDEQAKYTEELPDGKKAGLVDDDKDSESTDD